MTEIKGEEIKEFLHLDEYYLKITLSSHNITLICCNTNTVDNFYKSIITSEEIIKNAKYNNISLNQLYKKIIMIIENKKYMFSSQNNSIILSLYEGEKFDFNKDLQFIFIKESEKEDNNEHSQIYKNIIKNLKKDYDIKLAELDELKLGKTHSAGSEFLSFPGKIDDLRIQGKNYSGDNAVSTTVQPNMPNPYINNGKGGIQKVEIDNTNQNKPNILASHKEFKSKKSLGLNISALANLNYGSYPSVELSSNPSDIIAGYAGNSYNGLIRKSNEDKIKMIPNYKLAREVKNKKGEILNPKINYFAIYDGHGGNKCSIFLQEHLHEYIFNSNYFPLSTIQAIKSAYIDAENKFLSLVYDSETKKLSDRSGSCAVSALFIDEWCFIINLGDSRGLYSHDTGNKLFQITRDHKPNDPIERERVEKAGGQVYKDDIVNINGEKRRLDQKNLAPGVVLPYRIIPGNIAVSYNILFIINIL